MFELILKCMWFLLPGAYSNMAPVLIKKIPAFDVLDIPVDGGRTVRGQPLFGRNKTVRGFFAGTVLGLIVGLLQFWISETWSFFDDLEFIELGLREYVWLGLLQGFGALVGDAVESFFKRQLKIKPGNSWFPFDQVDFVLGVCLFTLPIVVLELGQYVAIILVGTAWHPIIAFIGWKLKMKDKPI